MTQENRFGFLPISVQKFLHTDNKKCQASNLNFNIKENHACLLRYSVEQNPYQSFIACIADIWYETNEINKKTTKEKKRPSIKRMKEILIDAMNVDTFVKLQNGSLIQRFYKNGEEDEDNDNDNDLESYADIFQKNNSKLYEIAHKPKPDANKINALIKVAKAYKNFIDYLKDDTILIDYAYIWDLICMPNPKLFKHGLNLVILNLPRRDITDAIEIICPTNHYSATLFDTNKSTLLILKIDNVYEPIYEYYNNAIKTRAFNFSNKNLQQKLPNLIETLHKIKEYMKTKCGTFTGMPMVYKFEQGILLNTLIHHLKHKHINYTIENQVLNYDSKVIGVTAISPDNKKGFIPCFPSAMNNDLNTIWMNDVYTDTYENTKTFIEQVYNKSKKSKTIIPCNPMMKVVENEAIVGFITTTNQFIMFSEPKPISDIPDDGLPIFNSLPAKVEETSAISLSHKVDDERVNYIKKIKLETQFYNVFRNTCKILLGNIENKNLLDDIEEINKSSRSYITKLKSIDTVLKNLMAEYFEFNAYDEEELLKINNITSCYNKCENKPYCKMDEDNGKCKLMIPSINLINEKLNDTFYYGKLADEIIRYSRIKSFIFNPKNVLSFNTLSYNLRENEIILLQSLLTQEYFDNIILAPINKYITYNSYDTSVPLSAQKHSNEVNLQVKKIDEFSDDGCTKDDSKIELKKWKDIFPANSKEIVFKNETRKCTFNAILTILKHYNDQYMSMTIDQLKKELYEEYMNYYKKYKLQLLDILKYQGKKKFTQPVLVKQLEFKDMIESKDYYATSLDIWLLVKRFNIPLILIISRTLLIENGKEFMVLNKSQNEDYYFLKIFSQSTNDNPYTFVLISDDADNMRIKTEKIRDKNMNLEIRNAQTDHNLEDYIKNFSIVNTIAIKKTNKQLYKKNKTINPPVLVPTEAAAVPTEAAAVPTEAAAVPQVVPTQVAAVQEVVPESGEEESGEESGEEGEESGEESGEEGEESGEESGEEGEESGEEGESPAVPPFVTKGIGKIRI